MWRYYNPNPLGKRTIDCSVRALSAAENMSWDEVYDELYRIGKQLADMENHNATIGAFLKGRGYTRHIIPDTCPICYTVREFCKDHPLGTYVLGTGSHVVTVINGDFYDAWDSGDEVPIYYWEATE